MAVDSTTGFFKKLFDWDFNELITRSIIKIVYIIWVILIGLIAVIAFVGLLTSGGLGALLAIVVVPIFALLYLISVRIGLEVLVVVFRIADDVAGARATLERPPSSKPST